MLLNEHALYRDIGGIEAANAFFVGKKQNFPNTSCFTWKVCCKINLERFVGFCKNVWWSSVIIIEGSR